MGNMSINSGMAAIAVSGTGWRGRAISPRLFKMFCSQLIIDTGIYCMVMFRFHTTLDI